MVENTDMYIIFFILHRIVFIIYILNIYNQFTNFCIVYGTFTGVITMPDLVITFYLIRF